MDITIKILLWLSILFFFQTWLFYPIIMRLLNKNIKNNIDKKDNKAVSYDELFAISIIVPVYNSEDIIIDKIENLLELDYPNKLVEIIIVSDGSNDNTIQKVTSYNHEIVHSYELEKNSGKSAAQNYGVNKAKNPIIIFTDVESKLDKDTLKYLVTPFQDNKIGCVGSNVQFYKSNWELSGSQGFYWRMEDMIRRVESSLGVLISVCGSAIAVRKSVFKELDEDTGDDFIIPLDLAEQGYKTIYADEAIVHDKWPARGILSEIKVRRRITSRNFKGLLRRMNLLNPIKYPLLSFSLVSHKLLRWLSPLLLINIIIASLYLAKYDIFYFYFILLQLVCIFLACVGVMSIYKKKKLPILNLLGSFLITNIGVGMGLLAFVSGKKIFSYRN